MSGLPGPKLVKGGFVYFDAPGSAPRIIAFQYNPACLRLRLESLFSTTAVPATTQPSALPREIIEFTLALDAADKLEVSDAVTVQAGILPLQAALELLMYAPASTPHSLTVFVSGQNCILPVRVTGLQIVEQVFDSHLSPIRVEVAVTLIVLNSAELSADHRPEALAEPPRAAPRVGRDRQPIFPVATRNFRIALSRDWADTAVPAPGQSKCRRRVEGVRPKKLRRDRSENTEPGRGECETEPYTATRPSSTGAQFSLVQSELRVCGCAPQFPAQGQERGARPPAAPRGMSACAPHPGTTSVPRARALRP